MTLARLLADERFHSENSLVCVTGKMASGKNFVCARLERCGWSAVDADVLVHEAITECAPQILSAFGEEARSHGIRLTDEAGGINRRELGRLLFARPELLRRQEELVYPVITKKIEGFIGSHPKTVINATVLYKIPRLLGRCDCVVYVRACGVRRLVRAHRRDGIPLALLLRRFKSQRGLLRKYRESGVPVQIVSN